METMSEFNGESRAHLTRGFLYSSLLTVAEAAAFVVLVWILPGSFSELEANGLGAVTRAYGQGPITLLSFFAIGAGWLNGIVAASVWGGLSRWLYFAVLAQALLATYVAVPAVTRVLDLKISDVQLRCTFGFVLMTLAGWCKLKWEMLE